MSTAPSITAPYEIEALVIAAAQARLSAAGFHGTFAPGSDGTLPDQMTAVRFALGDPTGVLGLRSVDGSRVMEHAEFTGRLEVDLEVARDENVLRGGINGMGVSRVMDGYLARLRVAFLNHPPPFAAALPWWQVTAIVPQATQYDLNPQRETDFVTLAWELTLRLMPDALPAV